jgi:hypothetical protein
MVLARGIPKEKMKPYLLLLTLGLSLLAATAQDRATKTNSPPPKTGDYYSWQHPEWPPMPGPVASNLPTYRLSQTNLPASTNYLVDDRGHSYQPRLSDAERKQQANDAELARFPELVAQVQAAARSGQEQGLVWARAYRLAAAQQTNAPAPYSFSEYTKMKTFVIAGAIAATNREAVRRGVNISFGDGQAGGMFGGGYFACGPDRVLRLMLLAQRAIASTNRADTEVFFNALEGRTNQSSTTNQN